MVKIYALMSGNLVLYIGKTVQSLIRREASHRSLSNTTASRYIPTDCEWEMVHIDDVSDDEDIIWEQYYYDTLNPLYNYHRPGQTKKEWLSTEHAKEKRRIVERKRYWRLKNTISK